MNFRRKIGNLCAISSKGKRNVIGILCTMPSMLAQKMEQKMVRSSLQDCISSVKMNMEHWVIPNIQHTLLGQQSTIDISRTQHRDKNRDADDIVVLSSDSLWPWRMLGRAILNCPELLDTWYVCLYPLSHPIESYLKENNILQMSFSWEE